MVQILQNSANEDKISRFFDTRKCVMVFLVFLVWVPFYKL